MKPINEIHMKLYLCKSDEQFLLQAASEEAAIAEALRYNGVVICEVDGREIKLPQQIEQFPRRIVSTAKVEKTERSYRIRIEGNKLLYAGFEPGSRYSVDARKRQPVTLENDRTVHLPAMIFLTLDSDGERRVTNGSQVGRPRPIIDLHDNRIVEVFADGAELSVEYLKEDCWVVMKEVQS